MPARLVDSRYDKVLDAVVFEAEIDRALCRGQMPVRDLILAVGRLLHPDGYLIEFHRALEEGFIDPRAYLTKSGPTKSWTPWTRTGSDARFGNRPSTE
jgi:hypothetical protein